MARSLTKKQRGFVKDFVHTGIGVLAVKNNYEVVTDDTARAMASENLTKPNIQEAIEKEEKKIADRIPDDLLVEKHLALLNKVSLIGNEIDVNAVRSGLDMAYKLKSSYAPERTETKNINITVTPKELEIAKEYEAKLKEQL